MGIFISDFNQMAYKMIGDYNVASAPEVLLICGGEGLGKTTLINCLRQKEAEQKTVMTNGQAFASAYAEAAQHNGLNIFRRQMRSSRLFLMDDIHLLANKKHTIEEMLYTYEYISKSRGKMVLTLQGENTDLGFLGERLESRLRQGLIINLYPLSEEEKKDFIALYLREKYLYAEQEAINQIAGSCCSLTEIKSRIRGYILYAEERGLSLSAACFADYWKEEQQRRARLFTPENIIRQIALQLGLDEKDLIKGRRQPEFIKGRQMAMYLMHRSGNYSLQEIGDCFSVTHGAVHYGCQRIASQLKEDRQLAERLRRLEISID